jgi:hypothetical protein
MTLRPGDVIWWFDGTTTPPKSKMIVCVCVAEGWFFRINSKSHWASSVPLSQAEHTAFLQHDSFLECGAILDILDAEIDDAVAQKGVLGRLSATAITAVITRVAQAPTLTAAQQQTICKALASVQQPKKKQTP